MRYNKARLMRALLIFSFLILVSYPIQAEESEEISWESLLAGAEDKSETAESKPSVKQNPLARAKVPEDLEFEWDQALKAAGHRNAKDGLVQTFYPNGSLQSKRIFNEGLIEKLKWYSLDGILIFEGDFEKGKLVHRKRYDAFTGELTSEWP